MARRERYSIYPSEALDRALAERVSADAGRDRSTAITAMCDRYAETCRRSLPRLTLREWLLVFDSLNGVWLQNNPAMVAAALAHEVGDNCRLNGAQERFSVTAWPTLVAVLEALPFAAQLAVIDAAERFWATDTQPDGTEVADDDIAHWRAPIRALVGPRALVGEMEEDDR